MTKLERTIFKDIKHLNIKKRIDKNINPSLSILLQHLKRKNSLRWFLMKLEAQFIFLILKI